MLRFVKILVFALILLASILCFGCGQFLLAQSNKPHLSDKEKNMKLEESSMNFDAEYVIPFLERLKPLIEDGFSDREISQVRSLLQNMEVDEEKELEFPIKYKGEQSVLRIEIFMDDIDAPDVYFYTHPKLAEEIDKEFEKFADELGI